MIGDSEPVKLPLEVEEVTIGPELTAVIGESMWHVEETDVNDAIAGFTISTDVTAKGEWPGYANENHQYITGTGYKIFPTFRPALSTYEPLEIDEVANLDVEATVDDETIIRGSTPELGFSIPEIFSHVSRIIKLQPGDLVALGDPGNPDKFIDGANMITCSIDTIGNLTNPVTRMLDK
jgi:2-keto-4-pentenoate hydratase/2-oxohepta-3-ene-1,7-dioic acid hydratase in catechol pathway